MYLCGIKTLNQNLPGMKHFFTLSLSFLITIVAAAQNFDNPVEYLGYVGKQHENISKRYLSYTSASAHGKRAKKVEALRMKLLDEVQEARMNIAAMPSFKGDKAYHDTAVNFMKLYFNVLNDDYGKIVNMEEIAEQSYDEMEAYLLLQEKVSEKLSNANETMHAAEKEFAAKNKVNLVEGKTEVGEMMKQVGAMEKYYHQVYLIFFKPYKQEQNLMQAIEKGNITGIEQNKNSLLKYAQEGLEKLNAIKAFQGDGSVLSACKNMLNFYAKEAGEKTGSISDFFLTKERFEKIKKEYEKKGSPTKQDVDEYNKAVNDINKASDLYNKNNQQLNQQRSQLLDEWNNTVSAFYAEHTPRYK